MEESKFQLNQRSAQHMPSLTNLTSKGTHFRINMRHSIQEHEDVDMDLNGEDRLIKTNWSTDES